MEYLNKSSGLYKYVFYEVPKQQKTYEVKKL
jgi:hypothetical protein